MLGSLTSGRRERSGLTVWLPCYLITLTFADSGGTLELRQWDVVDAQAAHTTIVLTEMRPVADIPANLFIIQDLSPFKRNG